MCPSWRASERIEAFGRATLVYGLPHLCVWGDTSIPHVLGDIILYPEIETAHLVVAAQSAR